MREIKFRAFDRKIGMFSPPLIMFSNGEALVTDEVDSLSGFFTAEIMQYTGFQDLVEYDIYDGDILQVDPGGQDGLGIVTCEVYWNAEDGSWKIKGRSNMFLSEALDYCICHLIGNIHENPELLA